MSTSVIYALVTVLIVGALLLVAVQVRRLRYTYEELLDAERTNAGELHQGKETDAAIRRTAIVVRQKRAARQRKARRRMKH